MTTPSEQFCGDLVTTLRYWIDETNKAIEQSVCDRAWLNQNAFERIQPLLRQASPSDRAALLTDFGVALLHSVLQSFEQRTIHPGGRAVALVEADTRKPLNPELNELFISTAMAARVIRN